MNASQEKEIEELYKEYQQTLTPLIQSYEVFYKEFPITILNEIRAITSHLAKCYNQSATKDAIDTNIEKAKNHLKRAVLDGYKYNCLAIQVHIDEYKKEYSRVLDLIDNGNFIDELYRLTIEAQDAYLAAKQKEGSSEEVIDSYSLYEDAYNKYCIIFKLLKDKRLDSEKVKALTDKDYKRKYNRSTIWNIIMGAVSVASLLIGILGACHVF